MNNFLRQFGSLKKNQKGLNEYVDYLGAKYTQDPQTGMWKSNGRSLNEQMLFEEAMRSQGGYGGEEGSGGRSQASRGNYTIGFAESVSQSSGMADPFEDNLLIENGTQTDWNGRYVTNIHTTEVPIKLKLISKNEEYTPSAVTLVFRAFPITTTRLSLNLLGREAGDETSTYNIPYPAPTTTASFRYSVSRGLAFYNPGDKLEYTVQLINAQLGTVIDTISIVDTQT